jgi:hypothetical protein
MKPKKFSKKLGLNKKTIANLNGDMMGIVKGGITVTEITCDTQCGQRTCQTCPETCYTICHPQEDPGGEMIRPCY